ncbi:MAG: alpha/beta hydrolase [Bacteroidetes bacterium]|nr:MAG: alpha/beta hydrolase [Bacteroidota bacterium]
MKTVVLNSRILGESSSPDLVILHGLLGSSDNWQTLAKRYAEKFRVHLIDARNHGRSPHIAEHSYKAMSEDLLNYLDTNNIEQAALLGHSMGGKTVMTFTELHPDRVTKLIIADIAARAYESHHGPIFEALKSTKPELAQSREEVSQILESYLGKDPVLIPFLMKSLRREKSGGYSWRFNVDALYSNLSNVTEKIELSLNTLPTLLIYGGASTYVNRSDIDAFEKLYLRLEIACLEESGHWLHAQEPNEFYEITDEFLD